jgi:phage terminase small subunit
MVCDLAYSDIRKLFDTDGRLRPVSEWPPDLAAAVRTLQSREEGEKGGRVVAVRLWDKTRALEMLFKPLGLLKESVAHAGAVEIRWKGDEWT